MEFQGFGVLRNLEPKINDLLIECDKLPSKWVLYIQSTGNKKIDKGKNDILNYRKTIQAELYKLNAMEIECNDYIDKIDSCLDKMYNNLSKWQNYKNQLKQAKEKISDNISNNQEMLKCL